MPFTLAHPAAVLPIQRLLPGRTVASALVIGSLIPDLPNLLPRLATRSDSHSLGGVLWFCLPLGLAAYVLFHLALARPLADLLPPTLAARVAPFLQDRARFHAAPLGCAAVSILLGALSHVLWDSFTHPGAPFVQAMPSLLQPWFSIGGEVVAGHRVLQFASTFLGLAVVVGWCWRWCRRDTAAAPPADGSLSVSRAATLAGVGGVALGFALHAGLTSTASLSVVGVLRPLRGAAIAGMQGLLLAVLAFSLAWHAAVAIERARQRWR